MVLSWAFVPGLLLTLGLLGLGAHELRTMEARESHMFPMETGLPRIWQNAKVCRQYGRQNEVNN